MILVEGKRLLDHRERNVSVTLGSRYYIPQGVAQGLVCEFFHRWCKLMREGERFGVRRIPPLWFFCLRPMQKQKNQSDGIRRTPKRTLTLPSSAAIPRQSSAHV